MLFEKLSAPIITPSSIAFMNLRRASPASYSPAGAADKQTGEVLDVLIS